MHKPFKTAVCSFLIIICCLSSFGALPVCAEESSCTSVRERLDAFVAAHPNGSSWPEEFAGAISCFGFAKLAVYNIFGLHSETGAIRSWDYWGNSSCGMTLVDSMTGYSPEDAEALLRKARPGDILQLEPYTRNQHTMIVYAVGESSWTVYDCNWDGKCSIRLEEVSFGFFRHWQGAPLHLLRADNYDEPIYSEEDTSLPDDDSSAPDNSQESEETFEPPEAEEETLPSTELPDGAEKCEIIYDGGDCENTPEKHFGVFENGKVRLTLADTIPTKNGFEFKGWLLFGNSSFDISLPGQELRYYIGENEPLTFAAVWERLPGSLLNFTLSEDYDGRFEDVGISDWFYGSVSQAFSCGLMNGRKGNLFSPDGNVTIAEAITLACRLHSIYYTGTEDFAPAQGEWYQKYVNYALSEGIIGGEYEDYSAPAKRREFAKILASALPDEALQRINSIEDGFVPDVSEGESFGKAVYALYRAGILTGSDEKHSFLPDSLISRAEAAAIITRMAFESSRKTL